MNTGAYYHGIKRRVAFAFMKRLGWGLPLSSRRLGVEGEALVVRLYPQSLLEFTRCRRLSKGQYNEARFLNGFLSACSTGAVVYDIGAHIGTFSLLAARKLNGNGPVYAFEMDDANYRSLCINGTRNKLDGLIPLNKAVSRHGGTVRYARDDSPSGSGTLAIDREGEAPCESEAMAVDEWVAAGRIPPPDVVKIDVEGHEMDVVEGMRETLQTHPVHLFVELHATFLEQAGQSVEAFDALMKELGYARLPDLASHTREELHAQYKRCRE